jgi:hypothetical protein
MFVISKSYLNRKFNLTFLQQFLTGANGDAKAAALQGIRSYTLYHNASNTQFTFIYIFVIRI